VKGEIVRGRLYALLSVGAAALVCASFGCAGGGDDRAGGKASLKPITLTMANAIHSPEELQPFADEVARLSDGGIRIEFENVWLGWPWRRPESGVIRDVAAGKADLGWTGPRAWRSVGVTSFEALLAPLLVDRYDLEAAILESGIPDEMLVGVERLGLVGIGVLPGPMRKLVTFKHRLVRAADFRGATVGITESRIGLQAMRALGATAVAFRPGTDDVTRFDALEEHVASIEGNRFDARGATSLTTNLNLWARPLVVFMNETTFAALEPEQRDLLRKAARDAGPDTLAATRAKEQEAAATLCRRNLGFVAASAADLAGLRNALSPVYRELERDAQTRSFIAQIEELRRELPVSREDALQCSPSRETTSGGIPNGTYANTTTRADARRAGIAAGDPFYENLPTHHRLVLTSGAFVMYDTFPDGHTEAPGFSGRYSVYRDRIVFQGAQDTIPLGWSFKGKTLRFDDDGKGGYYGAAFTPPWTKTG
jgi:TRAP-type C4-dicarboxylate transport system substrate-binding protein